MSVRLPIPRQRILSLMPTYRCTAACKSCGTLSSPHAKARLTTEQVIDAIDGAYGAGIHLVVFTGGEATLEMLSLHEGLRRARELGMRSRLVTNAHWAETDSSASEFMREMRDLGLGEINFSTGDQHARFVPVETVLRAVRAALTFAYHPHVMVETTAARRISSESLEMHPYQVESREIYPGLRVTFSESPWMPLNPGKRERYPDGMAVNSENLARVQGCDSILSTVTVQSDGRIGACCGLGMRLIPELNVGTVEDTSIGSAIAAADEDLLKHWIRVDGPERILAWAACHDPSIEWEGMYAHRCQACLRLYRDPAVAAVLREHFMEEVPNMLFTEFLLDSYVPEGEGAVTAR